MKAILRREGLWDITETHTTPAAFPAVIAGEQVTQTNLKKKKAAAMSALTLSVDNDIVDHLKKAYASGDQSQILGLTGQLQNTRLSKGESIEDYIKKAREIKNRLGGMGEKFYDKSLAQLLLNGLPCSFESTIQSLIHQGTPLTFDQVAVSLIGENK